MAKTYALYESLNESPRRKRGNLDGFAYTDGRFMPQ